MKKAGLFGLGCVLAVLLCELVLRIVGYTGDAERSRHVFDPRYGTVPRDSWIFDFKIDPKVHRAVDLRGQLVPLAKAAGETRVLFLGDSATQGAYLPIDKSYPLVFQRLLDERNPSSQVRVVNAGVWGMTSIDEYYLLKDKLLPLAPDVVVIGLFMANDINFNLGHVERKAAGAGASWVDVLRSHSALMHFLYLKTLAIGQRLHWAQVVPRTGSLVPTSLGLVDSYGLHMLSYPAGELATYMTPPSSLVLHAFDVLDTVLRDFIELGKQHGFRVRLLLIPSVSHVLGRLAIVRFPRLLSELEAQGIHVSPNQLDFDAATRRVLALCDKLDLTCMDPTLRLRRLGSAAFFQHDEHPSALGHEALARELLAH
jgi:hypothetical protein